MADIRALHDDDTWVVAQRPRQLAMTDIDGIPRASQKPGVAYHDPIIEGAPGHVSLWTVIFSEDGGMTLLQRQIPYRKAMAMLLTGQYAIQDVLLFPQVRPEAT